MNFYFLKSLASSSEYMQRTVVNIFKYNNYCEAKIKDRNPQIHKFFLLKLPCVPNLYFKGHFPLGGIFRAVFKDQLGESRRQRQNKISFRAQNSA